MSSTENTPLLASRHLQPEDDDQVDMNDHRQQTLITIALTGFISMWTFWTFSVDWPDILLVFDTPSTLQGAFVTLSPLLTSTFVVLVSSVYASAYGKRTVLVYSTGCMAVGAVGIAIAPGMAWLLVFRFIQTLGTSPIWSLGISTLGDMFDSKTRGRAVGLFISLSMLGAIVAPFFDLLIMKLAPLAYISRYQAWRVTQGLLAIASASCWSAIRSGYIDDTGSDALDNHESHRLKRLLNPFSAFSLLQDSNILCLSFGSGLPIFAAIGLLWMELSLYRWPFEQGPTEDIVFRRFLPVGAIGLAAGAIVSGIVSDKLFSRPRSVPWSQLRENNFLLTAVPGGLVLIPLALVWVGALLKSAIGGGDHLPVDNISEVNVPLLLFCFFLGGVGTYSVVVPCLLYFVEVAPPKQSVELIAASDALQTFVAALAVMILTILAQAFGAVFANTCGAVMALSSPILIWTVSRRRRVPLESELRSRNGSFSDLANGHDRA
ncbi:MFS general substrate transporter [Coprinopsis marcescibilis]|uniref:MFS general substrate transporter n=1 Tax=Coprinopsis marcescibilis TaxID=230819 RepID=A0A5C3KF21_COPMA|nr:MFS general substrate transporter [Coprinopsis marcescibilis]